MMIKYMNMIDQLIQRYPYRKPKSMADFSTPSATDQKDI